MTVFQITSACVLFLLGVVSSGTPNAELKWTKHYDLAKRTAQEAKRPLVVVIENPLKVAEKIDESKLGFDDRKLLVIGKFELCRVDATTAYGKKVAAAFGAKQFPYTVVTDKKSKRIVFRKPGQMSQTDWTLALAKSQQPAVAKVLAQKVVVQTPAPSSAGIAWQADFATATTAMQSSKRPLLLFLTAPGCVYCDKLKAEAFQEQPIINEINNAFIAVQVNGRERRDISERFQVSMYPTLAIIHPSGEVVELWNGFKGTADFVTHLANARNRLDQMQN